VPFLVIDITVVGVWQAVLHFEAIVINRMIVRQAFHMSVGYNGLEGIDLGLQEIRPGGRDLTAMHESMKMNPPRWRYSRIFCRPAASLT